MSTPDARLFIVDYVASDFPPGMIKRIGKIEFTANELAHALFITGRAPGDRISHGTASVWEFLHRTSLVPAYVRRDHSSHLVRSRLALDLDRSEKVGLSYALGQAMSGIFCRHLLSLRFLMHIDRYAQRYNLQFSATRKRADLFGLGAPGWMVVEAKGRSNSMEYELRDKLTEQKRSVISIANQPPGLALGCVASFPEGTMKINAFDPEAEGIEELSIDVSLDRYLLAYYEPFIAALDFGQRDIQTDIEDDAEELPRSPYITSQFQQSRLQVGLLRTIEQRVRLAMRGELAGLGQDILSFLADQPSAGFSDGTLIETDWEEFIAINDWTY